MTWLKNLFASIARFFATRFGYESFRKVLPYVKVALPYIELAALVVSGRQEPSEALARLLQQKFPTLFAQGIPKTEHELKLFALAVATELLRQDAPELTTNELRKAIELAYADYLALKEQRQ